MKSEFELLIKGGSICFYGDWFGRPYDNFHQITEYAYEEKELCIYFDEGECLRVTEPIGIINEEKRFVIADATKVEWEHHLYGATIRENDRITTYVLNEDGLIKETNVGIKIIERKTPYYAVLIE